MSRKFLFLFLIVILIAGMGSSFATETTPEKSIYTGVIDWYNAHLNYGTITLLMTIESSFIPFPSEIVVPPAAYKALQPGSGMNIILVVFFATCGAMIGALVNYYLARFLGRPIVYKFADSRLGHFFLLNSEGVEKAESFFREHGVISTFIGRFIPAIRQLISIPAGLAKMNLGSFTLFTALGALIWNIVLAILGYIALGQQDLIEKYSHELSLGLYGLGIAFFSYMIYCGLKKNKKRIRKEKF